MRSVPLLFDVDGVILGHHPSGPAVYVSAIAAAFREFDVDPTDAERRSFVGDVSHDRMRAICTRYGLDLASFWPVRERHVSARQQELCRRGERTLFDDVRVLAALAADRRLGFVSNNQQATIDFALDHFELDRYVETAYGREPTWDGFERCKPSPYYIRRALDDLETERALYVGDRASDVLAAHRADLTAVLLRRERTESVGADVHPEPDAVVRSLTELPAVAARLG